jgi:plastocyanin
VRASTRDRLLLPVLLPVGIVVLLAAALFAFSRVLLSLPASASTGVALVVAVSILVVSGIAASRAVVRTTVLASVVGVIAGISMLAGGVALIATAGTGEGGHGGEPGPGPGRGLTVVADDLQFQTDEIRLVAGQPTTLTFDNQDAGQQHNIAIFPSEDDLTEPLFRGDIIMGPDTITYELPPLDPGTYYFHCDVHPAMNGTVVVEEAPSGDEGDHGDGGGAGGEVTVTAQALAFDTDAIELPAGRATTIVFDNQDPGQQHNIAIYPSEGDFSEPLFRGDIITGPDTITYQVPPLDPGTYYFHCDVHPAMNGSVVVG